RCGPHTWGVPWPSENEPLPSSVPSAGSLPSTSRNPSVVLLFILSWESTLNPCGGKPSPRGATMYLYPSGFVTTDMPVYSPMGPLPITPNISKKSPSSRTSITMAFTHIAPAGPRLPWLDQISGSACPHQVSLMIEVAVTAFRPTPKTPVELSL